MLVEKLDRDSVRRFDKGHTAIARRPVDGHALLHQPGTELIDVVNLEGEMAEVATTGIGFGIPVVGELDGRVGGLRRHDEDKGEAALLILMTADFLSPNLVQ